MEIDIISRLKHGGVVGYFHSFDDAENTYLIQELCTNGVEICSCRLWGMLSRVGRCSPNPKCAF